MTVATGVLIDGPAPQAPIYTLIGAAQLVPMGMDEHYLLGAAVRGYPCGPANAWEWCGHLGSDGANQKITVVGAPSPTFGGFTVYFREECSTFGVGAEAYAERVNAIFPAVEAYAVEREFWTGAAVPGNPHLAGEIPVPGGADGTIYPASDVAQTAMNGLALLEAAIATTGRQGLIHCSPSLATMWRAHYAVDKVNVAGTPRLQTINGTTVVPGYGYQSAATVIAGSTPVPPHTHAAPTGTQEWAFATGPVEIRRSQDVEMIPEATEEALWQAVDRTHNVIAYEAARHYLVTWDACFKAAVRIDRTT